MPLFWGLFPAFGTKKAIAVLCSEATIVNSDDTGGQASILRCKRWNCELCRPFNRWKVIKIARRGQPNTFITLTCNPMRYETPDEAARDMKRALVLLRRHVEERYAVKNLPFVVVFERTQRGWPHMHILCRVDWIDQKWLSGEMAKLIGAPVVDIRRIDNAKKMAHYVSKYIGKDPHAFKGCKRWWRSQNYDLAETDEKPKVMFGYRWSKAETNFDRYLQLLEQSGAIIVVERPGYVQWTEEVPRNKVRWHPGTRMDQLAKDKGQRRGF